MAFALSAGPMSIRSLLGMVIASYQVSVVCCSGKVVVWTNVALWYHLPAYWSCMALMSAAPSAGPVLMKSEVISRG